MFFILPNHTSVSTLCIEKERGGREGESYVYYAMIQVVGFDLFPLVIFRSDVRLTSLFSLLDVGLLASLLAVGTMVHMGWSFGLRLFRVFQTEVLYMCVL